MYGDRVGNVRHLGGSPGARVVHTTGFMSFKQFLYLCFGVCE